MNTSTLNFNICCGSTTTPIPWGTHLRTKAFCKKYPKAALLSSLLSRKWSNSPVKVASAHYSLITSCWETERDSGTCMQFQHHTPLSELKNPTHLVIACVTAQDVCEDIRELLFTNTFSFNKVSAGGEPSAQTWLPAKSFPRITFIPAIGKAGNHPKMDIAIHTVTRQTGSVQRNTQSD